MHAALISLIVAATLGAAALSASAFAQDNAAQEMAHRQAILARLPADAAKRVFGLAPGSAPGPAWAIGDYTKGCVAGAVQLPGDGPNWQVMRPSRNRAWGHPGLIGFLPRVASAAPTAPGLAGPPGREDRAAGGRADVDRARLASDRARCRYLAHADAGTPAQRGRARQNIGDRRRWRGGARRTRAP